MNRKHILPLVVLAAAIGAAVFFVFKGPSPASTVAATSANDQATPARETGTPTALSATRGSPEAFTAPAPDAGVRTPPPGYKGEGWHLSSNPSKEAVAAAIHTDAVLVMDTQQQAAGSIPAAAVGAVVPSSGKDTVLNAKNTDSSTH